MKTEKARLDADGTAQPKTRIVHHPPEGGCVGPGTPLHGPEYEDETGARMPLYPIPRPHVIVNGKADRPGSGRNDTLTGEREVIRREAAGVVAGYPDPVDFDNPGGVMVYPERLMSDYKARLDGERPLDAPPLEE